MGIISSLKRKENFYYIFLLTMGIAKGTDTNLPYIMEMLLVITGLFFGLMSMVMSHYTKREVAIGLCLIGVGIISALSLHRMGVLMAMVLIISSKDISIKKAFTVLFIVQMFAFCYNVIPEMYQLFTEGTVDGFYQARNFLGIFSLSLQFRSGLGFAHPNSLQMCVFFGTILLLYIYYQRLERKHLIIAFIVNAIFYFITFSNTGLLLCFLYCVLLDIFRKNKSCARLLAKHSDIIFVMLVAGIIMLSWFYRDNNFFMIMNKLMTGRLKWSHDYMNVIPFTFFGSSITVENITAALDCGYIFILLRYGMVVLALYCWGIYCLLGKLGITKQYAAIAIIIVLHLYLIMENFMLICFQNYSYILLSLLVFGQERYLTYDDKTN